MAQKLLFEDRSIFKEVAYYQWYLIIIEKHMESWYLINIYKDTVVSLGWELIKSVQNKWSLLETRKRANIIFEKILHDS